MQNALSQMMGSKKFIASVVASLLIYFGNKSGMSMEMITAMVTPLMVYVGAQGIADLRASNRPPTSTPS